MVHHNVATFPEEINSHLVAKDHNRPLSFYLHVSNNRPKAPCHNPHPGIYEMTTLITSTMKSKFINTYPRGEEANFVSGITQKVAEL